MYKKVECPHYLFWSCTPIVGSERGHEKAMIQWEIDATDTQIDKLVYELYDLTDEEIAIV